MDLSPYSDIELHGLLLEVTNEIGRREKIGLADQRLEESIREAVNSGIDPEAIVELTGRVAQAKRDRDAGDQPPVEEPVEEPEVTPEKATTQKSSAKSAT